VFLWHSYQQLDDPAVSEKAKFAILLNAFLPDDPLYYLLTTSQVQKLQTGPFAQDTVTFPAGCYSFFSKETAVNVGSLATTKPLPADDFELLFDAGELKYLGRLSDADLARVDTATAKSLRIPREIKRFVTPW
jgi:hypothetical protein